jgi:AcrR family transcriptional regulator
MLLKAETMTPKAVEFDREAVLAAAVEVVRRRGLEGLTARSVAARLRASVAPVYSAFRSMTDLERGVLEEARRLMDEETRRTPTDIPFLNLGVGIVRFARDESRLFSALFLSRHQGQDILERFRSSILGRMKQDSLLRLLPDASLERLLDSIYPFTLGLATAIVYGQTGDASDRAIIRRLRDMGNILMYAEASGLADCESPENERAWKQVFKKWGIPWSSRKHASEAADGAPGFPGECIPTEPGGPAKKRKESDR